MIENLETISRFLARLNYFNLIDALVHRGSGQGNACQSTRKFRAQSLSGRS
jgi:hypothetical protein